MNDDTFRFIAGGIEPVNGVYVIRMDSDGNAAGITNHLQYFSGTLPTGHEAWRRYSNNGSKPKWCRIVP